MENKVYFATADDDYGGTYIAAKNIKEAKQIALGCNVISDHLENYIDLQIHWKRGIKTKYQGELNIEQINELSLTWWCCPNCDSEEFEILDTYNYKCNKCGNVAKIPYLP